MTSIWTGEKVRLRGVEPEDWRAFQRFDEYSADMRSVDMLHPPRSAAGYRRWAEDTEAREGTDDEFLLVIESLVDNTAAGSVSTHDTDQRAGRFSYGIAVGHEHKRRGYAADAAVLVLRYMFGERRFHKCEVGVYAFNEASLALHRKLGFQVEGTLREHEFFAGRRHDLVLLGLTAGEFASYHGM
ncbi:GNAT family N-acetyltransferase [Amycolatopsis suaedae]|uniref:N-acetyltransferase n=1 Tax=Amycolatopsis suaedae TaxID=2510978 RepID=A0A4V2ELF4_9PSEU|nr:GNAT family protein [Amycolatopsis suaedae]RZQ61375.1 N-acetyltransferase [Amycolatopsis suaedae]